MPPSPFRAQLKRGEGAAAIKWLLSWAPPPKVKIEMLKSIRRIMNLAIGVQFSRLRRGGSSRGVRWKPFAIQYLRKTDGAKVPAHGGVTRIRPAWAPTGQRRGPTRGTVLGKKRPSGRRITRSSNLMQDSGTLRATRAQINFLSKDIIKFGPTVSYAARQDQLRPFSFFQLPVDADSAQRSAFRTFEDLMVTSK